MALNSIERREFLVSALGMVRQDRTADVADIARRIYARRGPALQDESFFSFFNLAQSAIRTNQLARQMTDDPLYRPLISATPVDPTLDRRMMRFQYRAIIRATNPDTGEVSESLTVIRSQERLTGAEVNAAAFQQWQQNEFPERDYLGRIERAGTQPVLESFIISAGQVR